MRREETVLYYQNAGLVVMHSLLACLTLYVSRGGGPLPVFATTIGATTHDAFRCPLEVAYASKLRSLNQTVSSAQLTSCREGCEVRLAHRSEISARLPLGGVAVLFSLLSAFFHYGNAFLWRRAYYAQIRAAKNPFRWIEYTLSASAMFICLAWPLGMSHMWLLITSTTLIAVTMMFGDLTEDANRPAKDGDTWAEPDVWKRLKPHCLGWIPQTIAWIAVLDTFRFTTRDVRSGDGPPVWVQWVGVVQMLLFGSFGLVQFVLVAWGRPSQYVYGEYAYNALSLLSKGILSIALAANSAFTVLFAEVEALIETQTLFDPCGP